MDTRLQQIILFLIVQISALLALIFIEIHLLYLFIGWILFCGLASATLLHRIIAHKAYPIKRWMLFWSCLAVQGSPLWWASAHRTHHRYTDKDGDIHSPNHGLIRAYIGWIFEKHELNHMTIRDLLKYSWIENKYPFIILVALILCLIEPIFCSLWLIPAAISFHQEAMVNILCHYKSIKNIRILGWLTWGQAFHRNHHNNPKTFLFHNEDPCRIFTPLVK